MRLLTPALLFGSAAFVHWHNGRVEGTSALVFPFIDKLVPSASGDLSAMGAASVWLLVGLGTLSALMSLLEHRRRRARIRSQLDGD